MEDYQLELHLKQLEGQLLLKNKEDFVRLLADDFVEFGSSGAVYNKKDQLDFFLKMVFMNKIGNIRYQNSK